ncbi:MAG: hypothetical protein AMS19_04790 [Gemmatimonas sp. SG8_23]|nr:MAG: hypothetical protein AMS19_04790 [Gemmatimonas sp. SG8_23]
MDAGFPGPRTHLEGHPGVRSADPFPELLPHARTATPSRRRHPRPRDPARAPAGPGPPGLGRRLSMARSGDDHAAQQRGRLRSRALQRRQ